MTRITHITHIQVYAMPRRLNAASVVGMLLVLREQKLQCTAERLMKMIIYNFGHWQACDGTSPTPILSPHDCLSASCSRRPHPLTSSASCCRLAPLPSSPSDVSPEAPAPSDTSSDVSDTSRRKLVTVWVVTPGETLGTLYTFGVGTKKQSNTVQAGRNWPKSRL